MCKRTDDGRTNECENERLRCKQPSPQGLTRRCFSTSRCGNIILFCNFAVLCVWCGWRLLLAPPVRRCSCDHGQHVACAGGVRPVSKCQRQTQQQYHNYNYNYSNNSHIGTKVSVCGHLRQTDTNINVRTKCSAWVGTLPFPNTVSTNTLRWHGWRRQRWRHVQRQPPPSSSTTALRRWCCNSPVRTTSPADDARGRTRFIPTTATTALATTTTGWIWIQRRWWWER